MSRFQPRLTDRETLTEQEILDAVREHAAQMPGKSLINKLNPSDGCAYRSEDGCNACFVGALLTDDEAEGVDDRQDPIGITTLAARGLVPKRLAEHVDLLSDLQYIHDYSEPATWSERIAEIAANHGLR